MLVGTVVASADRTPVSTKANTTAATAANTAKLARSAAGHHRRRLVVAAGDLDQLVLEVGIGRGIAHADGQHAFQRFAQASTMRLISW